MARPGHRAIVRAHRRGSAAIPAALALALTAALPFAPAPSRADPPAGAPAVELRPTATAARQLELNASSARPSPPGWMGENVYFQKGSGFEYRQRLRMGGRPIEVGVQGPVVRKKKSLGLTLVVRF